MKICCLADSHMEENNIEIPECDILFCAGDYDIRTLDHLEQLNAVFYKWKEKRQLHIVAIGGNHDFSIREIKLSFYL